MDYAFDAELATIIPMLPKADFSDLPLARRKMAEMFAEMSGEVDATGVTVTDRLVPGPADAPDVPIRIYTPDRIATTAALLDIHGGGFIVGDLELGHAANIELSRDLGVVIVGVDYRLAPEAPFPAGLEDCYAALSWMTEHAGELGIDPERTVVHGASAGGGLAAGLALLSRDRKGPAIAFQFLAIPELDDRLDTPSMRGFIDTPVWNRPNAEFSWDSYLGAGVRGTDNVSGYAAPARATDLKNLPPAYISVMHFDPLRDEGIAYAQALLAAGVTVELHLYPGTFHGSSLVQQAAVSKRAAGERQTVLSKALAKQ